MSRINLYIALAISIALITSLMFLGFYLLLLLLPILLAVFFFKVIYSFFSAPKKENSNIIDAEFEIIDEPTPHQIEKQKKL